MIFSKGKGQKSSAGCKKTKASGKPCYMSGAAGMLPTMFDVEPVPKHQKIHQSELPLLLCEELLEYLTLEGEVVLDQFAGSGAIGIAAIRKGRKCILIEKLPENIKNQRAICCREKSGMDEIKMTG